MARKRPTVQLLDNKGRLTEGNLVHYKGKRKEVFGALQKLSAMSVWDLTLDGSVMHLGASIGEKDESNKDRKLIDLGEADDKSVCVYTDNTMGFVCVDGVDIFITSRFDNPESTTCLMRMLSEALGWSYAKEQVNAAPEADALKDLHAMLFPKFLKEALAQGLFRSYRRVNFNDMRVRGRMDVPRHISKNIPFNGRIAYTSREHTENNHVTQLIRHTIEFIRQEKMRCPLDQEAKSAVAIIRQATPDYDSKDFLKVLNYNIKHPAHHSYYTKYTALQALCISILQRKRIGFGGKSNKSIYGILFDGAWLWEEYMAAVVRKHFQHYTDRNSNFKLFKNENGEAQKWVKTIIPDFLSPAKSDGNNENNYAAVADAKYMRLEDRLNLKGEQAYSVYYKTLMYMLRFNARKGFIFYPMEAEEADTANETNSDHKITKLQVEGTDKEFYIAGFRIPTNAKEYKTSEESFAEAIEKYLQETINN